MKKLIKKHGAKLASSQKVRFGLVGVVNTVVDFIVLNVLVSVVGIAIVPANIVSTTVAMLTSFTLNKKAVFQGGDSGGMRQIVLFFAVSLAGIWLVQSSVLALVYHILQPIGLHAAVLLNVSKVIGICAGLVWNYLWYSRVVFKRKGTNDEKSTENK